MNRSITDLLKTISLFLCAILVVLLFYINLPFIFLNKNACIYVHKQEKFNQLAQRIAEQTHHLLPSFPLKIYAKLSHWDRHLEAGEYCFTHHTISIVGLIKKIERANRELRKFTLVDGWTYAEMIRHIALSPSLSDTAILSDKNAIAMALKLSENNLEGQFYPDTYYYAYPNTALDVLQRAHIMMKQRLEVFYQEPQAQQWFKTPYELLIAASIIQKEAQNPEDQMFVASVLVNRMKQHMKLQMDPTVMYGLGENYLLPLKKQDLKIDTLYNTYLHIGLPPTPICMPGETALYAAAHPKESNYLYYVSKKNGYHQFSETLEQHTLAIKKYLLHQNSEEKADEHHQ